ncbi:MAG: 4-hydroxythreonine-4-phosphate dehydrogenase PdxA [Longimicrobiaceae bacterium]
MKPLSLPKIALTLGDPRGIGPEVAAKALNDPEVALLADFTVIGPAGILPGVEVRSVGEWQKGSSAAEAGRLAGLAVEEAVRMALSGKVAAVVTGPIDKSGLRQAGYPFSGHTEMLRQLSGADAVAMMMCAEQTTSGGPLRVVLATTHLPLRRVSDTLTTHLLVEQTRIAERGLRTGWGIESPRIALCGVNPHASDGGLFGDEEVRIIEPALAALRAEGVDATGPLPADTVFVRALREDFDAVIAPYHDVGMAAFKTASFGRGVNVTLGLPFPRTSPDHGTALDIAGRGVAEPGSTVQAIRLAVRLARRFDMARR